MASQGAKIARLGVGLRRGYGSLESCFMSRPADYKAWFEVPLGRACFRCVISDDTTVLLYKVEGPIPSRLSIMVLIYICTYDCANTCM